MVAYLKKKQKQTKYKKNQSDKNPKKAILLVTYLTLLKVEG